MLTGTPDPMLIEMIESHGNAIEPSLEIVQFRSGEFGVYGEQLKAWLCLSHSARFRRSLQVVADRENLDA